jgi:hypothetical protein
MLNIRPAEYYPIEESLTRSKAHLTCDVLGPVNLIAIDYSTALSAQTNAKLGLESPDSW